MTPKLSNIIITYLDERYSNLTTVEKFGYDAHIIYSKNDDFIFSYFKDDETIIVSYDNIWSFLKSFFNLNSEETKDIITKWIERNYGFGKINVFNNDYLNIY